MTEIAEAVRAYNAEREALAATRGKAYGKQNWIMAGLALALAAGAILLGRSGMVGGAVALAFVGVIVLGIVFVVMRGSADSPGIELQTTMREQVFPALFSDVEGMTFKADTKGFYDEIPDALKPGGDRAGWGDLIEGTYSGQPAAINEISISRVTESGDERKTVQVFKGVALRTGLAQPVSDLIVCKNRLAVAKWVSEKLGTGSDMPHVEFDDPAFEEEVDVHCENEGFARAVFGDEGRARFMALKAEHTKGSLQIAATGEAAYVLLEHDRDFFELPPLDRPFDQARDGHRLKTEMQGFLDVIAAVREMLEAGASAQFRL